MSQEFKDKVTAAIKETKPSFYQT